MQTLRGISNQVFLSILLGCFSAIPSAAQMVARQKTPATDDSASLIADGVSALERNDLTEAKSRFEKAVQLNPRDATALVYLGIVEDRSGNLVGAEKRFAAAVKIDPLSASARNNHGASLLKLGRSNEAASEFENSLKLDKNQPNALVNLAQLRLASGTPADLTSAWGLFDQAYQLQPDVEIARALVIVSLRIGKKIEAARYYKEYSTRMDQGQTPVMTPGSRSELGAALLENDLNSEAIHELTAAVSAEPSNVEAIQRLARAHLAANDVPSAGRVLEAAVARGVDSASIYSLLASVYEKGGHIENAIPAMRLAIQRDPQSEAYRFTYGMLLISALAPDAAVIRLKEALELFPQSSRLWLAIGIAHFKAGRNDEAAKSLTRSIELDPKYAPAFVYLGMTYVEIGQYQHAIQAYGDGLARNDKLGIVHFLIADVMLRETNADYSKIEAHLLTAVQSDAKFAPARLALGKLYLRTARLNEAASEFENVVKLDPTLAETYYQLGLAYRRLKRDSEARAALDKFKALTETQKEQALKDRKDIMSRLANVLF